MIDKKNGTVVTQIGDTIASVSAAMGITAETLVRLNTKYISSVNDQLEPGWTLQVKDEVKSNSNTVTITGFGLQVNTTRTMYLTWNWDHENNKIDHYQVIWSYKTEDVTFAGNTIWYEGSNTNIDDELKQSTYNAPENAVAVKVKVRPVKGTSNSSGTSTSGTYGWTTDTDNLYYFKFNPPGVPSTPSVEINKYKLTAELNDLDSLNATQIEFQIVKDNTKIVNSGLANINTGNASYSYTVAAGSLYKVRCRAVRNNVKSNWSEYTNNVQALPSIPSITQCNVLSKTSLELVWTKVNSADGYEIQYTTKKEYFDAEGGDVTSITVDNDTTDTNTTVSRKMYNLATGGQYYVRVRAINDGGESKWSNIKTFIIGTTPTAPTTWSSTNSAIVDEPLSLYWIHNSADGSSQTWAELEITVDNGTPRVIKVQNTTDEEEKDKTSEYKYYTGDLDEGAEIQWRVRTAGVLTDSSGNPSYGDWSIIRTVNIYAPPVLNLVLENKDNETLEKLTTFPFYAVCSVGNTTNQKPTGYYINIIANSSYETIDAVGRTTTIGKGTKVYSKYFDNSENDLTVEFSANNVDLENNIEYTVQATVSMSSGLTTESSSIFTVGWIEETYAPFAEIGIEKEAVSAYIRPYSNGGNDVLLSVYRRQFDGTFLELATELENGKNTFITDPHPALDYARYRIVAKDKSTGAVSYSDVATPVGEKAIIIQWDDDWSNFETSEEAPLEQPPWSGSMLRLPYNIDISDSYSPDVSLVKYAGRSHPTSYYGTHLGQTSNWSTDIPKSDKETLYALRRLAIWMGDVYVREPSGSGYWANIVVSFSQAHKELIIPVTLNIKRVEGGV